MARVISPPALAPRLLLACWLCRACVVEAKFHAGSVKIGNSRYGSHWQYISKFGYAIGKGTYKVRVKLKHPRNLPEDTGLQLEIFLDESWDQVMATPKLCDRHQFARNSVNILVNRTGDWSEWVTGTINQNIRSHLWYFVLQDCAYNFSNFSHRLLFEFHAQQDGGSEFSVEMRYMLELHVLFVLGFTVFLATFIQQTRHFFRSADSVHPVVITLSLAMILQYCSKVLRTIHLFAYRSNGVGIIALDILSQIVFILSQVTQTSLLIIIGLGYTLLQSKIGELDLVIPMCFMVGVVHVLIVGIGMAQSESSTKFHDNEGIVGYILLVMRLLLYAWFVWAVRSTSAEARGMKLQAFCRKFLAAGSIYFLSYPMILMLTKLFAPYLQFGIMAAGLMAMQIGSNVWLASLFVVKGDYFAVSTLNASSLPGGVRVGLDKEE